MEGLNNEILIKKSYIDKLAVVKSNLEAFLLSLVITIIYFYSILLNIQLQSQKKLRILLIYNFNYLPLFFIVKIPKQLIRSKFNREKHNNNKKKEEQGKRSKKNYTDKKKRSEKENKL